MLLPELEIDLLACRFLACLFDTPCCSVGAAEVDSNVGPESAFQTVDVGAVNDTVTHATEEAGEVGTAKVGSGFELGEWILVGSD